jgi:hypothetical protein
MSETPEFAMRNLKVTTPNRNSQMKFYADRHEEPNPRVFSSPLTGTFTRNEMMAMIGSGGDFGLPQLNGTLYNKERLGGLNNPLAKNITNLRNFDGLNG